MIKISNDLMLGVSTGLDNADSLMETVEVMKELGINIVKIPVMWSELMPEKGKINSTEVDKYKKLLDEFNKLSIKTIAVLNDNNIPEWYRLLGGWRKRENLDYFDEFCTLMFKSIGNTVSFWITHNDPIKETVNMSKWSQEAPDSREIYEALNTAHNLNLAHGRVINIFRHENLNNCKIGLSISINPIKAKSMNIADILTVSYIDSIINKLHIEAIFNGRYPKETLKFFEKYIGAANFIKEGDMNCISTPSDFIGINYYGRSIVKYSQSAPLKFEFAIGKEEKTDDGREITPEYLYKTLKRIKDEYSSKLPILICECGGAFIDDRMADGTINDYKRAKFLEVHLSQAQQFIDEGGILKAFCTAMSVDSKNHNSSTTSYGIADYNPKIEKYMLKYSGKWYKTIISSKCL